MDTIFANKINDMGKNPSALNLLKCKCPRCRTGAMFTQSNPYSKKFMQMNERCEVCGQVFDLEVGFYYGSGFVSYALATALSVASFVAWYVIIGISVNDNRVFYWLIFNAIFLLALQPPLMRFARTGWLAFFLPYDPNWRINPPKAPDRTSEDQRNNW